MKKRSRELLFDEYPIFYEKKIFFEELEGAQR